MLTLLWCLYLFKKKIELLNKVLQSLSTDLQMARLYFYSFLK